MKIRLAVNNDAQRIKELADKGADLDWSDIYPYWLVAEKDGVVVGCLNVALSKPIGILDQLAIDESLNPHARARAVKALIEQGRATLRAAGASASISLIPFELRSYKRALKKHFGAEVVNQGNVIMARL